MSRADHLHKVAIGLGPSPRASTLGAVAGTAFFGSFLAGGLQVQGGWWPAGVPRLPVVLPGPVPQIALGVLAAVAGLTLLSAVVHGRRWRTYRRIVRLTAVPRVAGLLPEVEAEPEGPFATPQRPPQVIFEDVPVWRSVRPRRQVTRDRNVVGRPPLQIVYLSVFENGARARTVARGAWREFGYVRLLRSAASVSPAEYRRVTEGGRLSELVIDSESRFRSALARPAGGIEDPGWHRLPTVAGTSVSTYDRYGAYPVRALMCAGGFWSRAVEILLEQADLVVLDLSGYERHCSGTQVELQHIVDAVPVERVLLLADPSSRRWFLQQQVHLAWSWMAAGSPNAGRGLSTLRGAIIDHVVRRGSGSGPGSSRFSHLRWRPSRRQTRWLLRDVQMRLPARATLMPRAAASAVRPVRTASAVRTTAPARTTSRVRATSAAPAPVPPSSGTRPVRTGPRPLLFTILVVVVLGVAAVFATGGFPALRTSGGGAPPVTRADTQGVAATVVPGTEWNVRSGPSTSAAAVGRVAPGAAVVVSCVSGGWARLADPVPGGYVVAQGLRTAGTPPSC